ncbi:DUF6705 family protein [Bacteroides sp. GD17]|jgi:hypothetical protein|uniref:DUF6705 family protein n=1 Tax=Bacteroides sp. GD17 TaxID=3139826 RepID=UPI00260111AF|nr:DUF6705 family protein [uncultured Bacteroides sp.]
MNRIYVLLIFAFTCIGIYSQANYDAFVGTWIYQKNDTVFKIRLQKGMVKYEGADYRSAVFGGYYLSVKGVVKEDYIKVIPPSRNLETPAPSSNVYIDAVSNSPNYLGFTFYDQRKKHLNGKGILGGTMDLIAPDKLHWKLNEKDGLWIMLEGTDEDRTPRGFSVPDNCIMTKE